MPYNLRSRRRGGDSRKGIGRHLSRPQQQARTRSSGRKKGEARSASKKSLTAKSRNIEESEERSEVDGEGIRWIKKPKGFSRIRRTRALECRTALAFGALFLIPVVLWIGFLKCRQGRDFIMIYECRVRSSLLLLQNGHASSNRHLNHGWLPKWFWDASDPVISSVFTIPLLLANGGDKLRVLEAYHRVCAPALSSVLFDDEIQSPLKANSTRRALDLRVNLPPAFPYGDGAAIGSWTHVARAIARARRHSLRTSAFYESDWAAHLVVRNTSIGSTRKLNNDSLSPQSRSCSNIYASVFRSHPPAKLADSAVRLTPYFILLY